MPIIMCPHCDELYDADTHVEHEEMCKEEKEDNEKALRDRAEEEYVNKMFDNPLEQIDELIEQAKELKIKYRKAGEIK